MKSEFCTLTLIFDVTLECQTLGPGNEIKILVCMVSRGSSVGIAIRHELGHSGDRIPVRTRFSAPVQTGFEALPASCTACTGSFPGIKRPGRGVSPAST